MSRMAKEGRPRKSQRRDWPGFFHRLIPPAVWQALALRVPARADARRRWSPKYVLLCWVLIGWSLETTLRGRFEEAGEVLRRWFSRRRRAGGTYQGLRKATRRLGVAWCSTFWEEVRRSFPARLQRVWHWYGWVPMAVDGSRIDAPRTRRNEEALGRAGRAKTPPQWWVTVAVHLPTAVLWDWRTGPGHSSERAHLREMMATLPDNALVVADAGFGGFDLLGDLAHAGHRFLVRCGSNVNLLVEGTWQQIERAGEHRYVYLWPLERRDQAPLRLRLIVLKQAGKRVYLLTNVLDPQRLSRRTAGQFYRARWGVEVSYRALKQTLGHRKVLARTPAAGALELAGYLLGLGLLMLQGAIALGRRAGQLSVAAALRVIRWGMRLLGIGKSTAQFVQRLQGAVKDSYTRRSSKRARDWPHQKREHPPGPPKLRRPTAQERTGLYAA